MLPFRPIKLPRRVAIALVAALLIAVGVAAATTATAAAQSSTVSYWFENRATHGVTDVANRRLP